MTTLDTIIAVKNVEVSAEWYRKIFGFINVHGGDHFAVLTNKENEIIICLHSWGTDNHPTMTNPNITTGNGLLLYIRTADWKEIKKILTKSGGHLKKKFIKTQTHSNKNFHLETLTVIS